MAKRQLESQFVNWTEIGMKVRHTILRLVTALDGEMPCDTQFTISTLDYQDNTVEFDITYAVQHAHANGNDSISLGFWVVEIHQTIGDLRVATTQLMRITGRRYLSLENWRTMAAISSNRTTSLPTNLHCGIIVHQGQWCRIRCT